jgi:AFG3 family protein
MAFRRPGSSDNKQSSSGNDSRRPNGLGWIFYIILAFFLGQVLFGWFGSTTEEITWSKFKRTMLVNSSVEKITIVNKQVAEVTIKEEFRGKEEYREIKSSDPGPHYSFNIGSLDNFEQTLEEAQKDLPIEKRIDIEYVQRTDWWGGILSWLLPFIIIIAIWLFILNRMRPGGLGGGTGGGGNIFEFGKAGSALKEEKTNVTFEDVAGLEEVKVEVREIVDFLKNAGKYTRLGAKIPKGVLLIGPPGTGKTLLAKAVAGEAGVPFYSMSGSEFVEMFVGVGASRVRDLFKKAKQTAPSIIFIDEIDAIGRSRSSAMSLQSNDERENTLNQLLTDMDGFGENTGVIVLAATNRGEVLDRALLRPGRFDRQIYLELPTKTERRAIFEVHTAPLTLSDDIDLEILSAQTPGFSGADIANICNEAALIAARNDKEAVSMTDFYAATDRVIAGLEKKSKIVSEKEKRTIAFHEAGHATASWYLPYADTLLKVSIVPRGRSLGAAWYLPQENQLYTKAQFLDRICATLGGRASEEIVFGEITSGALDDLEKVTKQAYMMVDYYGLDEEFGTLSVYGSAGRNGHMRR